MQLLPALRSPVLAVLAMLCCRCLEGFIIMGIRAARLLARHKSR